MNYKVAFSILFVLGLVLAACAPRTQSDTSGEVRTESSGNMAEEMTGGAAGMQDMEMGTGGEMDMQDGMEMGTGGMTDMDSMTGGMMDMDSMTGGEMDMEMGTGGMGDMSSDAQTGMESDTEPPMGTLEAAASPAGPFYNDRPDGIDDISDERVVSVSPGDSFFLRVQYSDESGISDLGISLRNSAFQGNLPTGPFTVDEAASTSTCDDQLATTPTELNCTIKVDVAADAQNIDESGEFAYVFRARVTDAADNSETDNDRGYVAIR